MSPICGLLTNLQVSIVTSFAGVLEYACVSKELCVVSKANPASIMPLMIMFCEVIEFGSFSAAGRKLGLSPSAVSRQIGKLEGLVGATLLNRSTRALTMTEAGLDVFNTAQHLLNTTLSLQTRVQSYNTEPQGLLRVTAPITLGKSLLAGSAYRFLEKYPAVSLDLIFTDSVLDLSKDAVELAIRVTDSLPDHLVARELFSVSYVLVCSLGFSGESQVTHPDDLSSMQISVPKEVYAYDRITFESDETIFSAKCLPRLLANNSEAVLSSIVEGIGIGILPNFIAAPMVAAGQLRLLLPAWRVVSKKQKVYLLSHATNRMSPRAKKYTEFLIDELRGLTSQSLLELRELTAFSTN